MFKNLIRGARAARCSRLLWPLGAPPSSPPARRRAAAGRRLRLRHADRRGRLDLPARARPARAGARARAAGEDDRRRVGRRGRRRRARDARPGRAQGATLVFATSFGYLEPALRVAAEFPHAKFEHAGGYKSAPNLATYDARYYEARWLAGWLAGQASRSGVAGYVAGFPVPEVVQGINAFTLGMRAANPKRAGARALARTPGSTRRASATRRRR